MCTGASPQKIAAKTASWFRQPGDKNECLFRGLLLEEIVFRRKRFGLQKLSYFFGVNRMVAESRGKTKRLVAVVAKVNSAAQGF